LVGMPSATRTTLPMLLEEMEVCMVAAEVVAPTPPMGVLLVVLEVQEQLVS